jgi:hypothetical protein
LQAAEERHQAELDEQRERIDEERKQVYDREEESRLSTKEHR